MTSSKLFVLLYSRYKRKRRVMSTRKLREFRGEKKEFLRKSQTSTHKKRYIYTLDCYKMYWIRL